MTGQETNRDGGSGMPDAGPVAAPDLSRVPEGSHRRRRRRRMSEEHIARLKRRRRNRRIAWCVAALLVALAAWGAFLTFSALSAKREIQAAVQSVSGLPAALVSGDAASADAAMAQLGEHIDAAYRQTSNPLWVPLEFVPYYGADVHAARAAVGVMEDVANNALPQLRKAVTGMDVRDFGVSGGRIFLPGLAQSAEPLRLANEACTKANVELGQLDGTHVRVLTDALDAAKTKFSDLAGLVDAVARFAQIAPTMFDLDDSGPHTYLVIGENNAELRASGGLPASWGTMRVEDGVLEVSDFIADTAIARQSEPVTALTLEEGSLFGDKLATIAHDVNITPDFPRTGQIAKALWEKTQGQEVDGVLAVDPLFLQALLKVTGSVRLEDGTVLDGSNTADLLLHDEYYRTDDHAVQDAFFADAAGAAFRHAMNVERFDAAQLLEVLSESASQGHVKMWFASASLQRQVENTPIGATLGKTAGTPRVGVYLNNAAQSKMDWYLERSVKASHVRTLASGASDYDVHVTLTNAFDVSELDSTPQYVLGDGIDGLEDGQTATLLYVTAPADGRLVSWEFPDGTSFDNVLTLDGLTVGVKRVVLDPGQSWEATIRVRTSDMAGENGASELIVQQTPLIRQDDQ